MKVLYIYILVAWPSVNSVAALSAARRERSCKIYRIKLTSVIKFFMFFFTVAVETHSLWIQYPPSHPLLTHTLSILNLLPSQQRECYSTWGPARTVIFHMISGPPVRLKKWGEEQMDFTVSPVGGPWQSSLILNHMKHAVYSIAAGNHLGYGIPASVLP